MLIAVTHTLIAFVDVQNLERVGLEVERAVILRVESLRVHGLYDLAGIAEGLDASLVTDLVHVLHLPQLLVLLQELLVVQPQLVHLVGIRVEDRTLRAHHVGLVAPGVLLLRVEVRLVLWLGWLVVDDACRKRLQMSLIDFVLVELFILLNLVDSFRIIREIGIIYLVLKVRNLLNHLSSVLVVVVNIVGSRVVADLDLQVARHAVMHAASHLCSVDHL